MEVTFDETENRVVIVSDDGIEVKVAPERVRDVLPTKTEAQRIQELEMMIHDIDREKLCQMKTYIESMIALNGELKKVSEDVKSCDNIICIKVHDARIKTITARKNALAEIRRTIGLMEKDKKELRVRKARLETGQN